MSDYLDLDREHALIKELCYRYARKYGGARSMLTDPDDLAQTVIARIYTRRPQIYRKDIHAYLNRSVRNAYLDGLRLSKRKATCQWLILSDGISVEEYIEDHNDSFKLLDRERAETSIELALRNYPIIFKQFSGTPLNEIAKELNIPIGTASNRAYHERQKLQQVIKKAGGVREWLDTIKGAA